MSEITEKIRGEFLNRCESYKEKTGYDFWEEHIQYVVKNAVELAKKYGEKYVNTRRYRICTEKVRTRLQ